MATEAESGLLFGWTLEVWLGFIGFFIASAVGIMQIVQHFLNKPLFKIAYEVKTITDSGTPYTYFDLIITNKGRQTAKGCVLTLTVEGAGARFEKVPIFWGNPRRAHTNLTQTVDIMGDGDDFKTAVFEMNENQSSTVIRDYVGRRIDVEKGKTYTFIFSVNSDPPAKKTVKYEVEVKDWNNIKVKKKLF